MRYKYQKHADSAKERMILDYHLKPTFLIIDESIFFDHYRFLLFIMSKKRDLSKNPF